MRLLSPDLLAAQKSASAVPYLRIVISDLIGGVRRLTFARLYTGSEPDNYHAATMPGDGSLIRCRIEGGQLYLQRVVSPGAGSDFSAWTAFASAANADVALASDGARVLLFYIDPNGTTIYLRESNDNGASFGAAVTVANAASAVGWLAAALKATGDALLAYSAGATVYTVKGTSGTWGTPTAWSNSVASISGLTCYYRGDWNVVVAGEDASANAFLWTTIYGDGFSQVTDTWSQLREVMRGSVGSGVSFAAPFLAQPDSFRLTFVEKYSGSQAYSRPLHTYGPAGADYASNLWREPVPLNLSSDFGLAIAFSATVVWLSSPAGVWRADLNVPTLEVSADVLEAETEDRPFDGRFRLALRNDDGRYNTLPAAIKLGAEVAVSPGYLTASGPQASEGPAYWIEAMAHTSGGGQATLILQGHDGWGLLRAWRARRQYAWSADEKNVIQLLAFVFARAGLNLASIGASATALDLYPSFAIHPGESGFTAVRRLLAFLPDVIFFSAGLALLKDPQAGEAASYAYGSDHALLRGRYGSAVPAANRVQLFGDGIFQERFDWASLEGIYDRLLQVHDLNLTSVALADDRGDAELRRQAIASTTGEVVVPVNCGQELYDVVEVTDAAVGVTAAKRRVLGIDLRYLVGRARPVYEQRLALGGV